MEEQLLKEVPSTENIPFGYYTLYIFGMIVVPFVEIILLATAPIYIGLIIPSSIIIIAGCAALIKLGCQYGRISTSETSHKELLSSLFPKILFPEIFRNAPYYIHVSMIWVGFQILIGILSSSPFTIFTVTVICVIIQISVFLISFMVTKMRYQDQIPH